MSGVLGDVPEKLANGKRILPEGIRDDVTPPISKVGEHSIPLHPAFYTKESILKAGKKDTQEERPLSHRSNDSFNIAIKKYEKQEQMGFPKIKKEKKK